MNRSLLLWLWLACLALCQSAAATPLLPHFSGFRALADTTRPIITCPPSDTIQLGPGQCGQVVTYSVTATDDQSTFNIIQAGGIASGGTFPIGVTVNSFIAMDAANNTSTCSFTIRVLNYYNILVCNELSTIQLGANCTHLVVPTDILATGENGCSANFLVEVDKTFPFGNGPWLPPTMTMADVNKSYQFRVTSPTTGNRCFSLCAIKDIVPPTISCQDINIPCAVSNLAPAYLKDSLGITNGLPTYLDNCGNALTLGYSDVTVSVACNPNSAVIGTVTRTWTARDASNNQSSCVQKIYQVRLLADVRAPADVTLPCGNPDISSEANGRPFIAVGGVHFPLLPNSSCDMQMTFLDTLVPQCGGTRSIRRTWRVYDGCLPASASNPKVGTQNLEIRDAGLPTVTCPPTTVLRVEVLGCQGKVKLPSAVISDGCSGIATFTTEWPATEGGQVIGYLSNWPGNNPALRDTLGGLDSLDFPTGTTIVRYNATDACGNTGSCSFTLIVADTILPTAFCKPALMVQLSAAGTFSLAADSLDDGSTDECNAVYFKARRQLANSCQANNQFYDAVSFCCTDIGDTVSVRLRVYDAPPPTGAVSMGFDSIHTSECLVRVVVTDPHSPQCTAPPDVVVPCATFDASLNVYGELLDRSCTADSLYIAVNYSQFDTTCHRGQIVRTFRVSDTAGNSGECTQQITVNGGQNYFVRFPNDTLVTSCSLASPFGRPAFFGLDCEDTQVTYTDQISSSSPGICFRVERTWKVINYCQYDSLQPLTIVPNPEPNATANAANNLPGPVVSASGTTGMWAPTLSKLLPTDTAQTNFSRYWSANTNGYQYKQVIRIVDTQAPAFVNCPSAALTYSDSSINSNELWNEPFWLDPATGLRDLSDASVVLSATAFDACQGENINLNYVLFLDLDGSGDQETVVRSTNLPNFGVINFGNAFNTNYMGGSPRAFDERTVPNGQKYGFALETVTVNHQKKAWVRWNTAQTPNQYSNPQLPRGKHKIIWTAEDGCGNTTTCQYNFTIRDGLPPTLTCPGVLLMRNISADHTLLLDATEFPRNATDNYTPAALLKYALRRPGGMNVFPVDSLGHPQALITYTCDDIGPQGVQLWVRDQDHNASFCTASLVLSDPDSICLEELLLIDGNITNPLDMGISDVQVGIYATYLGLLPYSGTTLTDSAGYYVFPTPFPSGTTYVLTPGKDGNDLNGVTTYDLVLISQHILSLNTISSPYKLIAADANKSNSVSALDIVELRKLILGVYDLGLPNTTSWRFVDKAFVFPNPSNPFQTPFPEKRTVNNLAEIQLADNFVGIKVGDVNCSAMPGVLGAAEDRTSGTLWFEVADRNVQAGETMDVTFRATERVAGYQFTLDYPGLEVLNIQPGAGMQTDNFAVFPARNALTTSFNVLKTDHPAEFTVRFRARQTGPLRQLLQVSGSITPAEAYVAESGVRPLGIGLHFGASSGMTDHFELFPVTPNPFREQTTIGFRLPAATTATLSVFDAAGRVVYMRTADYEAGFHALTLHKSDLGGSGVFFCQLQTSAGNAVQKMVVLK